MEDKTKQLKKDITYVIRTCKKVAKTLAKQHNMSEFINRVSPLQRTVKKLFSSLFYENTPEYNKIKYKEAEFENFIDTCWRYCQGDTRIILN